MPHVLLPECHLMPPPKPLCLGAAANTATPLAVARTPCAPRLPATTLPVVLMVGGAALPPCPVVVLAGLQRLLLGARAPPGKWPRLDLAISPPRPDTKEANSALAIATATEDG